MHWVRPGLVAAERARGRLLWRGRPRKHGEGCGLASHQVLHEPEALPWKEPAASGQGGVRTGRRQDRVNRQAASASVSDWEVGCDDSKLPCCFYSCSVTHSKVCALSQILHTF